MYGVVLFAIPTLNLTQKYALINRLDRGKMLKTIAPPIGLLQAFSTSPAFWGML
jgi:hypothetical protein